jgi:hypothetical protein
MVIMGKPMGKPDLEAPSSPSSHPGVVAGPTTPPLLQLILDPFLLSLLHFLQPIPERTACLFFDRLWGMVSKIDTWTTYSGWWFQIL